MRKKDVLGVDKTRLHLSQLKSLSEYKQNEAIFIRSNNITYHGFVLLLAVYNRWFYERKGCSLYWLSYKSGLFPVCSQYNSMYNKMTTLNRKGFVDCIKVDGSNVFTPTDKAIEGINSLLSVIN